MVEDPKVEDGRLEDAPSMRQKMGLDDAYNEKLMREWRESNQGEPAPMGGMRFFPMRLRDFYRDLGINLDSASKNLSQGETDA